jgi:hypothetical protein
MILNDFVIGDNWYSHLHEKAAIILKENNTSDTTHSVNLIFNL